MLEDIFESEIGTSRVVWSETGGQIFAWPELGYKNIFWIPPTESGQVTQEPKAAAELELPAPDSENFVHGGVPLVGPWFAKGYKPEKQFPQHGWFHLKQWVQVAGSEGASNPEFGTFTLECHNPELPVSAAKLHVKHNALQLKLELEVTAAVDFELESAYHTYFHTTDLAQTKLSGLKQVPATDASRDRKTVILDSALEFTDATDLVFEAAPTFQFDSARNKVKIEPQNASRIIVWNPWGQITGWQNYVCVETAVSEGGAVQLNAGESHSLGVTYSLTS